MIGHGDRPPINSRVLSAYPTSIYFTCSNSPPEQQKMTYRGHIIDGRIALDEAVILPEGAEVQVQVIVPVSSNGSEELASLLLRHAGKGNGLPTDLAEHHDHYAHGRPKP
jgi:hypothetical protein